MKMILLMGVMFVAGCASVRAHTGADSCPAPTPEEARITKRVWM